MSSPLSALGALITSGIATIETAYAKNGDPFPSLDKPGSQAERLDAQIEESTAFVIAAAAQLIATLRSPASYLFDAAGGMQVTAALGVVTELNIAEVLREGGPQGLHVKEIGKRANTDSGKIGRVLRFLAIRHIFREVQPDVFANNRISSKLDTGKPVDEIVANPIDKHFNTSGFPALIQYASDEVMKSAAFLANNLADPKTAFSDEGTDTPMNRAFNSPLPMFEWMELPENTKRHRRFGPAMLGSVEFSPPEQIVNVYDWKSLKKGDLVVDVAGGIGSITLHLAKAFPDLNFVIQDRAAVVPQGIKFFEAELPEALSRGQVKFQEHDFFNPQPIKNAAVFFMRFITHNWSDTKMKKILRHLRSAAQPKTKLVFVDHLIPHAAPTSGFEDIPGGKEPPVPKPLLPNLGIANSPAYIVDMAMMEILNTLERTVGGFVDLVDGTGWKLVAINRGVGDRLTALVFDAI